MSPLTRHDAQGCAGLALALAWAAAVAWKDLTTTSTSTSTTGPPTSLSTGTTGTGTDEDTAQEDRLADAVQAAKSNEENLAALQVELNSAITAMQEALGSVERALGQPQAEIDARAAELRAGAETSIAAIDSAALNAMAYVRERTGPRITDAVPPAFDPLVTSFESVVNARGGSATQAVTVTIPGNEYHAAGTFLDLVIDGGEGTGGITTSEGKYLVLPTNTNWTIIAAISYASPDGWSMLKIINPDSHRSYGNYILAQQEINGSMGLDTASAVVYVDDSTIRIGIKVTNANATSWVRGNNLSRVLLIPSKNPPA